MIQKVNLFLNKKELFIVVITLFLFILSRLFISYINYKDFISKPFYYTNAKVITIYPQSAKNIQDSSQLVKVKSKEGYIFFIYLNSKRSFKNQKVRVKLIPNKEIRFIDFMTISFFKYKIKDIFLTKNIESKFEILQKEIISQHKNNFISEFYSAIFLATPISKELRLQVSKLGVSHLIALSGFHLSILWIFIYKLIAIPYKYTQKRYFPYRHSLLDIGFITILTLGFYLWFVDMPPSLIRSYSMILFAWILTLLGIEIFSFSFLLMIVLGLLSIDISLFFSIAFWLSVSGVFYIYLIGLHTKNIKNKIFKYLIFPIGIFFLMLPVVHTIFDITSILQPFSILLSLIFILFYPISIFLHILGYGYIFDKYLLLLIDVSSKELSYLMPLTFDILLIYLIVSITSIFSKNIFWFLVLISISYAIYLFI